MSSRNSQCYGIECNRGAGAWPLALSRLLRTAPFARALLSSHSLLRVSVKFDVLQLGPPLLSFQTLVEHNNLKGRIQVIPGRVEEVHVPEQVDIIISEPMGYMLFNERMLETYIHARVRHWHGTLFGFVDPPFDLNVPNVMISDIFSPIMGIFSMI